MSLKFLLWKQTHYKKYIFTSIITSLVSIHALNAASTAAAALSPSDAVGVLSVHAPLKQLTMADLAAEFKPKAGADGKFAPEAEETIIPGGYLWGTEKKAATTTQLITFLEEKKKENKLHIDLEKAGVRAHVEAMHKAFLVLLNEDAQIFATLAEVRRHMEPANVGRIASSQLTRALPAAFSVAGCFAFAGDLKDAVETVDGQTFKPVKPIQDLFAGWIAAGENVFEGLANTRDNSNALYQAILKLMSHNEEAREVYTRECVTYDTKKAEAMRPDTSSVVRVSEVKGRSGDFAETVIGKAPDQDKIIKSAVAARTKELEEAMQASKMALDTAQKEFAAQRAKLEAEFSAKLAASVAAEKARADAALTAKTAEVQNLLAFTEELKEALQKEREAAALAAARAREEVENKAAQIIALEHDLAGAKHQLEESDSALAKVHKESAENEAVRAQLTALQALYTKNVGDYEELVRSLGAASTRIKSLEAQIVGLRGTPLA